MNKRTILFSFMCVLIVVSLIILCSMSHKSQKSIKLNPDLIDIIVVDEYASRTSYTINDKMDIIQIIDCFNNVTLKSQLGGSDKSGYLYTLYFIGCNNESSLTLNLLSENEIKLGNVEYELKESIDYCRIDEIIKKYPSKKY